MKKLFLILGVVMLTPVLAHAQSSGNFTYGNTGSTHCVVNGNTGAITGGATCSAGTCATDADCASIGGGAGSCQNINSTTGLGVCVTNTTQTCAGTLGAAIKTSSGLGNVFVVRPSAVIGLLTDVSVQKNSTVNVGTSSAYAGVDFQVYANQLGAPATAVPPCVTPSYWITYAARFIQISTNLFDVLGSLCTTVANPNPVGGVTTAVGCFISFSESTVSAHSFDWVVGSPAAAGATNCTSLSSGTYGIGVNWQASLGNTGISQSLTCVGPVNVTVEQNKVFHFNSVN